MIQASAAKYWNTWDPQSPARMVFLPAQFVLNIGAYSHNQQKYTNFLFSPDTRLGYHHANGDYAELHVNHAGTTLKIEYAKPDPFTLLGRISTENFGEWGLRFWLLLSGGFATNGSVKFVGPSLLAQYRSYHIALCCEKSPLGSGIYDSPDQAGSDMEKFGYYYPSPKETVGNWGTMKFHLEEMPILRFALAVSNDPNMALERAQKALQENPDWEKLRNDKLSNLPSIEGDIYTKCLEAVRDVMAWNTIQDNINQRWYTSLTRLWISSKFGGWFTWLNDVFYHALIAAWAGDWETSIQNVRAALDGLTPQGNLSCMLSEHTEWVDRSQPPIGSFIVWQIYLLTKDKPLIRSAYPALKQAFLWWFANRDGNGNGILEYGTSAVGSGAFIGTKLAAKDESSMDNSPMYDEAVLDPVSRTLNLEDIALNSLLVLDGEILAKMALELGHTEDAPMFAEKASALGAKIHTELWDDDRQIFAGKLWNGRFSHSLSPTSFYPLLAGVADPGQTAALLQHLVNNDEFGGKVPLPSVTRNDPAFKDNVYWRGRMWPPLNFLTYYGLKRNGLDKEAHQLVRRSLEIFLEEWEKRRHCHENYNGDTGAGCDSVDSDPFYGWGALLPLLGIIDHLDIDPWNGFHFGKVDPSEGSLQMVDIPMGDGIYSLTIDAGVTSLTLNGTVIFITSAQGRFRHFKYDSHFAQIQIPAQKGQTWCEFPETKGKVILTQCNGESVRAGEAGAIALPTGEGCLIKIWY